MNWSLNRKSNIISVVIAVRKFQMVRSKITIMMGIQKLLHGLAINELV